MKVHMNDRYNPTSVVIELDLDSSYEADLLAQSLNYFTDMVDEKGLQMVWSGNYGLSKKIIKRIRQIENSYYSKRRNKL